MFQKFSQPASQQIFLASGSPKQCIYWLPKKTKFNSTFTNISLPQSLLPRFFLGHGEGVLSYRCTYKTLANEEGCHFVMAPKVTLKFDNIDDPEARKVYTLEVSYLIFYSFASFP